MSSSTTQSLEHAGAPAHERYQFKPFTGSSHSWALNAMASLPASTRVLDIGPGSGAIGKALGDRGWQELDAVEIDPAAREHVRPYYREVADSVSAFRGRTYDLVLLLDVIEHMAAPEAFMAEISELLAPGGMVLVSVPNIAHWSVRFTLLFGKFRYTERGLLDRTHLQFFTRARVREIERRVPALTAESFSSSIEPIELLWPNVDWHSGIFERARKIRLRLAELLPGMFAFQHLAVFRKK